MSQENFEQLELDFTEGENEMEENKNVIEAEFKEVAAEEGPQAGDTKEIQAQVVISLLADGRLDVNVPEGMPELKPADVEELTRRVNEQLRDMRIAQNAIEIFKARLG
jgi:hypothetical protein